jgi:hypothetical protein
MAGGALVPVASGNRKGAIAIRQKGATLLGGASRSRKSVLVPEAKYIHLFVAKGEADLEIAGTLFQGDSVRLTDQGQLKAVGGAQGSEILIWETGTGE